MDTTSVPQSVQKVAVKITWLKRQAGQRLSLPEYATAGSAGMDVCAAVAEDVRLAPGDTALIPTGFAVAIPAGYEIQVRPRSGLAVKHGITIVNSPGTIDSDYRGEVKIALINLGQKEYRIQRGDRVAQLVLAPVVVASWQEVDDLDTTLRGGGGFGHTGVK